MAIDIRHGDCLEVMRSLPDSSVDSVVTDPPYGLAFMGKRWDYDVPSVEVWQECLRVLKPGGHLLAFAGTRTQHRMAVRIEDAGFEIRDMIAWVYGSGFPKSLDVSKAIDGSDAIKAQQQRRYRFTEWVRSQGVTSAAIDAATGTNMGGHYTTAASQPAIMTREHLEQCRHLFGDVPEWVEQECNQRSVESENIKRREVIGQREMIDTTKARAGFVGTIHSPDYDGSKRVVNITAPATDDAKRWQGWGTALKPALEPITMARKPLIGTVAENVLTHGTGAINVDGCRVGTEQRDRLEAGFVRRGRTDEEVFSTGYGRPKDINGTVTGRWPANLIHNGSEEVLQLFPNDGDSTSARFFYCAKADQSERGDGNNHPTVKPVDLMRYLVRLVTREGGTVLEPFGGSGTTAVACVHESCDCIIIERESQYVDIIKQRVAKASQQQRLF